MASSTDNTLSAIQNSVEPVYDRDLTLQMNRHAPLLTVIPQVPWGAKYVEFDVATSGVTAGSISENYTPSLANDMSLDHIQPATLQWGIEGTFLQLGGLQMDVLGASPNPEQVTRDHIRTRTSMSTAAMMKQINLDIYSSIGTTTTPTYGSGTTNTIVGLTPGWIDATSNVGGAITSSIASGQTYGGISRATYTEFTGTYISNGTPGSTAPAAITTKMLSQLVNSILIKSNQKPSVIVMSPGAFVNYEELVRTTGNYRIVVNNNDFNVGPTPQVVGETHLSFQGIPVIMDYTLGNQETSQGYAMVYALNLDHMEVRFLPHYVSEYLSWSKEETGVGGGAGVLGTNQIKNQLPVRVIRLAKTGDYESFMLKTTLQLVNKLPSANGWITNIAI